MFDPLLLCVCVFPDDEMKQTVRENILFGKDMDRSWYKQVIKAYVPPSGCKMTR
jgi:hypothetical protein